MTRINIRDYLNLEEEDNECKLRQDDKDETLEAFILFDKDGDGFISTREIGKVIRSLGQTLTVCQETDIVAQFEQENCYDLDYIAFYRLVKGLKRDFDENDELREAFRRFDKEDNGWVDVEEMKKMLLTVGETLTAEEVEDWFKDGEEFTRNGKLFYEDYATHMLSK